MYTDSYGQDTMTVGELIEKLASFPKDVPVYTEGCDCIGNVINLSYYRNVDQTQGVLLERDN